MIVSLVGIDKEDFFEIGVGLEYFGLGCDDRAWSAFFDLSSIDVFSVLSIGRDQVDDVGGISPQFWEHSVARSVIGEDEQSLT